jgi:hypothetical protein
VSQKNGPGGLEHTMGLSNDEATVRMPPQQSSPKGASYQPGKASVGRTRSGGQEPTLTFEEQSMTFGGPGIATRSALKQPSVPVRQRMRMLRRGSRWSVIGVIVLVACWGLFALSSLSGDLGPATLALFVILAVGAFLFGLCRLVGLVVLERSMNRVRRSAWAAHAVAGLFWIAAGITYLTRIGWMVDTFNWIRGV